MATSPNFSWPEPDNTDLVKNGALAIRTAVNAIDSSLVDLKGGTTGQVLAKASGTDMDFSWVAQDDSNAIQNAIVDAKGDLIAATANDTPARLAVGTNGQVLTADSTTATGLKWAAAAGGGGKVLQVVQGTTATQASSTSNSFADTGLSVSITPSSATSKVLILVTQTGIFKPTNDTHCGLQIVRGSTSIVVLSGIHGAASSSVLTGSTLSGNYLDSPATTSATTYKTQFKNNNATGTVYVQFSENQPTSTIIAMEIGA